jgi:hypothetical protein
MMQWRNPPLSMGRRPKEPRPEYVCLNSFYVIMSNKLLFGFDSVRFVAGEDFTESLRISRATFNITNDFSPEEEAQVRKQVV